MEAPKTLRGQARRAAIVCAAAELMYERGLGASLEDILGAAGAGKSQLYHYFSSKDDLVANVLEYQLEQVLDEQRQFRLDTWRGLRAWFDALLAGQEGGGFRGCPVGSLALEMSAAGEDLRARAAETFRHWESTLAQAFADMRRRGLLSDDADPAELAQTTLVAIQGGYMLSTATRDLAPMARSLSLTLARLRALRP